MKLYHGTTDASAQSINQSLQQNGNTPKPPRPAPIPNNIDVCLGGGEFGQGFYLGENISLAVIWATGTLGQQNGAVLEFDINDLKYVRLHLKQLNSRTAKNTYNQLKRSRELRTYIFGVDVVFGPLVTNLYAAQYKFESKPTAEDFLNQTHITRIL